METDLYSATRRICSIWPYLPVYGVLSVLIDKYRGSDTVYFPNEISMQLGRGRHAVLASFKIMCEDEYQIVRALREFVDERGQHYRPDPRSVRKAIDLGVFKHPLTQIQVKGFRERLRLHYVPGHLLNKHFARRNSPPKRSIA